MTKEYDHYETYEWLGTFWTPDNAIQFSGKLTYTPENGVELEFLYSMSGKRIEKTNYIYGALSSGEPCTLYGCFDPDSFGFHAGKIHIYQGKLGFGCALFGENAPPEEKYDGAWLDLTNFQEFCHPQGYKDFAKYTSKPLQQIKTKDLEISLVNSGRFKFGNFFENSLYCENEDVVSEINGFFRKIRENYPDEIIYTRNDIGWILKVRADEGLGVEGVIKKVFSLESLISLLVYFPVRRKVVSVMKKSSLVEGKFEALSLLVGLFDMDKFKIDVLKKPLLHMSLPITPKNSNIADLFARWLEAEDGFELFAVMISNHFGKIHQHQLYAEIVLMLTQLEAISYSFGKKAKEKYTYSIEKYATVDVINFLKSYFSVDKSEKLGECLSDLRAEVAHVGKPPKHLKSLSISALIGIARCIKMIIACHIYKQLDISDQQIQKFQEQQLLHLPKPEIKNG